MKKGKTPEQKLKDIDKLYVKLEKEKEDCLIDLIVEVIVSSTMREYSSIFPEKLEFDGKTY